MGMCEVIVTVADEAGLIGVAAALGVRPGAMTATTAAISPTALAAPCSRLLRCPFGYFWE